MQTTMMAEQKRALYRRVNAWSVAHWPQPDGTTGPMTDEEMDEVISMDERRHGKSLDEIYRPVRAVRCMHCGKPIADAYAGKPYVGECCR